MAFPPGESDRGYLVPTDGELGSTFFTSMVTNITLLDAHTHNGADASSLVKTQTITSAGWTLVSAGTYSQVVTLPTYTNGTHSHQLNFDEISISLRDSNGEPIFNQIVRLTATTYTIYTNDNTLTSIRAIYI